MKADEAEAKFRSADEFYRAGRYKAALSALDELDRSFPNDPHVLLPRARALHKLGRRDEAIAICDELIEKHQYEKAARLKKRLLQEIDPAPATVAGAPPEEGFGNFSLSGLNIELEHETPAESAFNKPRAVRPRSINWRAVYAIGIGVLAVALFAARVYVRSQRDNEPPPNNAETVAADEVQPNVATGSAGALDAMAPIDTSMPPELVRFQSSSSGEGVRVNASVEYAVWTNAGSFDNFKQRYTACEPAAARFESMLGTVDYRILGTRGGRCTLEVRFEMSPMPDWNGKKMTCQCDPTVEFDTVVESLNPVAIANGDVLCTGPLADSMRAFGNRR